MSEKVKFALYLPPEKKAELERHYREDGSRSITAFIERSIDFYLSYLSASNTGCFLPKELQAAIDGRLGMFEDRMAKLLYKLTCGDEYGDEYHPRLHPNQCRLFTKVTRKQCAERESHQRPADL